MITMRLHANYKRGLHAKFCWQTAIFEDERSEEHTSELQSPCNLVCRLLLEKKKKKNIITTAQPRMSVRDNNASTLHELYMLVTARQRELSTHYHVVCCDSTKYVVSYYDHLH